MQLRIVHSIGESLTCLESMSYKSREPILSKLPEECKKVLLECFIVDSIPSFNS